MSFTLRQVTRRAGSGEIVRTRRIEADEVSIGRGADCDIQLPDLAVSLRHAVLRRTERGLAEVEALGRQPFQVDGRFERHAVLKVADRPRLVFGSHVVDVEPGDTADDILVTVSGAAAQADGGEVDSQALTRQGAVLNKRRLAWTLGLAILALCLALPVAGSMTRKESVIHADKQWSSGPLSKAHAFLETDCQSCHQQAFVAVRDGACLTCHGVGNNPATQVKVTARVRASGSPFDPRLIVKHAAHDRLSRAAPLPTAWGDKTLAVVGRAFNHPNDRCASCHLEHGEGRPVAGATPAPTLIPTLAATNDCAGCHAGLSRRLKDTLLIDTPDWRRHPDFRPLVTVSAAGATPRVERIALATRPMEKSGLIFPHRLHLDATGGVARMAQVLGTARGYGGALECGSCHRPDKTAKGFQPTQMARDCGACHSLAFAQSGGTLQRLPHGKPEAVLARLQGFYAGGIRFGGGSPQRRRPGEFAAEPRAPVQISSAAAVAGAMRRAFSAGGACYDCHTVLRPADPGSLAFSVTPVHFTAQRFTRGAFDHAEAAHREDETGRPTCANCHKAATSDKAEDLLLPAIAECAACHGKTKAQAPQAARAQCGECHGFHFPGRPAPKPEDSPLFPARPPVTAQARPQPQG